MYRYFKGQITEVRATHITLEVNNIGYMIKVSNPYQFQVSEETTIYLHYHIREDAHELYGFKDATTLDMFESLINVKGLGPKGALAILASSTPNEIVEALNNSNAKFFSSFPGIGPKLSQQIILDQSVSEKKNNVTIALKSLGYNNAEIKQALNGLDLSDAVSLSDAVKNALKALKKK